jgi:hypothetical protein
MNDSEREQMVRSYIEQALRVQSGENQGEELPDLDAVARELGMTDLDMAEVKQAALEHFERGSHYCRHRQWDDAITELKVATALDPRNVPALHLLAESHAGRWRENDARADRGEAERLAKRCIDLQADYEPAFALLENLKAGPAKPMTMPIGSTPASAARVTRIGISVAAMMVILGIGMGAFFFMKASRSTSAVSFASSSSSTPAAGTGRPIPFRLKTPAQFSGMTAQLDRSRIINSEEIYCLQGDVTPAGGGDSVEGIPMRLDMIDSTGHVVSTDQFTAWPCSKHPGSFNFHRDNPIVPGLREAILVVQPTGTGQ